MGRDPPLAKHLKEVRSKWLPKEPPTTIVVFSGHFEASPIQITSSSSPKMLYDYYGFPKETYNYKYPAPGNPELAQTIQNLLQTNGINGELNEDRGFDHGVFVPLLLMYPEAEIPVVTVSLDKSLSADKNIRIGQALAPLRDEGVLILGSGYSFHNMDAFFHPSEKSYLASRNFNNWLKDTILHSPDPLSKLRKWEEAPGARVCHPREEHLLPLFMTAASADPEAQPKVIYEVEAGNGQHAVSSYLFP